MPIQYGARYINTQVAGQVVCGGLLLLMIREKKDSLFKGNCFKYECVAYDKVAIIIGKES